MQPGGGGVGGGADVPGAVGWGVVPGLVEAAWVERVGFVEEAGGDAAVGGWVGVRWVNGWLGG